MRGALFMAISMAGFTANDAITKSVSAEMSMAQIMFVRGFFATVLIALLAWRGGALRNMRALLSPMVGLRAASEVFATIAFLVALAHLPLANVSAILQALPLAVTMGAALVLSEPVGWRRWLAIAVGFSGVMVIVRPGFEAFNAYSISALCCVLFCAVRDLATRRIEAEVPSLFVSTVTAAAVTVMGAALIVPFGGWAPLDTGNAALLFGAAILLLFGYHFIIMSMRIGDISFVAPFRYTALLWAILLGFIVFGDIPDTAMILGASIIVASGLYTLYRERVVGVRKPAAESTSPAMGPDGL
jgi:drug/metabolite transporter (DMT)-like permease